MPPAAATAFLPPWRDYQASDVICKFAHVEWQRGEKQSLTTGKKWHGENEGPELSDYSETHQRRLLLLRFPIQCFPASSTQSHAVINAAFFEIITVIFFFFFFFFLIFPLLLSGFAFANERSAAEFDEQRSTFFRANERYDHYLEIREGLDLVGVNWQEVMIATGGKGGGSDGDSTSSSSVNPWYNNQLTYWLFSVVLLSWPLRVLLEYNTAYVHYQVGGNRGGGGREGCFDSEFSFSKLLIITVLYCFGRLSNCLASTIMAVR